MYNIPSSWRSTDKVRERQRKRRSAAVGVLFGVVLSAVGLWTSTWLLIPAGALMAWSVKTAVESQRIDTAWRP